MAIKEAVRKLTCYYYSPQPIENTSTSIKFLYGIDEYKYTPHNLLTGSIFTADSVLLCQNLSSGKILNHFHLSTVIITSILKSHHSLSCKLTSFLRCPCIPHFCCLATHLPHHGCLDITILVITRGMYKSNVIE
jgi:hypothetical protein